MENNAGATRLPCLKPFRAVISSESKRLKLTDIFMKQLDDIYEMTGRASASQNLPHKFSVSDLKPLGKIYEELKQAFMLFIRLPLDFSPCENHIHRSPIPYTYICIYVHMCECCHG